MSHSASRARRLKPRLVAGAFVLLGLAALAWWYGRPPRWNVVLITLDTTRADHLGCYGHQAAATPHLDRLAAQSILFERAYTVVPITLPAHATMLTGLLPPEHGLRINGTSRLPEETSTLPEILNERGYRTGAFVSSLVLDSQFGLDRGFQEYDDNLESRLQGPRAERPADETVSAAISWLNEAASESLFCWVHLYDPHDPYDAHEDEFGDRFADAPYVGEIAYMDRQIGRLLDSLTKLGIDDNSVIIVVGDHGEGLGEHEEPTHGYMTYNSTLHVPLMIRHPSMNRGMRVAEPVSLADVFPTLLSALKCTLPDGLPGRSLLPAAEQGSLAPRPCYAESEAPYLEGGWSPVRAWMTDRWKYIQTAIPELYDLQADPHETVNLIDVHADEVALLEQELEDFESALDLHAGVSVTASDEQLKALRSLGYVGGQVPAPQSDRQLRDIKEMLPYAEQVHHCMHLIDTNAAEEARQILEDVVAAVPDYAKAWGTLGVCRAIQGDYAAAETGYRKALELDAHQNFARIGLGRTLYETDRLEECIEHLQAAVAVEPSALDAQFYLGDACRRLKRWDAARTALTAATEIAPDFQVGQQALADLERDTGNLEQAVQGYRRVLTLDPNATSAALSCARVLVQLGRDGEAIETLSFLLQVDPRHVDGLSEMAQVLATTSHGALRDPARAIELAKRACQFSNRRSLPALRSLAAANAAAGRHDAAMAASEEALNIAEESSADSQIAEIEAELSKYRERAGAVKQPGL